MKKTIYVLLFALSSMFTIVSCTEEPVEPQIKSGGGGGSLGQP